MDTSKSKCSVHSKVPEGVLSITMANRPSQDHVTSQRVDCSQSKSFVNCKSVYFFIVGILLGTMLGVVLNHQRMDTGLFNGNKCIVPCDQLLRDYRFFLPNPVPSDSKVRKLPMSPNPATTEVKEEVKVKIEVPSDIVPIPVGPFEEIETFDNSPSGIGVKFTRLGSGPVMRPYSVGIADESPISAIPVAPADAKTSAVKTETSKLSETDDIDSKSAESDLSASDNDGFFPVFDAFPSVAFSSLDDTFSFKPSDALTRLLLSGAFIPVEDSEESKDSTGFTKEAILSTGEPVVEPDSQKLPVQETEVPVPPKEVPVQKNEETAQPPKQQPIQNEEASKPLKGLPVQAAVAPESSKGLPVQEEGWSTEVPGFNLRFDSTGVDIEEQVPKVQVQDKETPQSASENYEFYISNTEEKGSWSDASKKCESRGMELVSIENRKKEEALERSLALVEAPESLDLFWTSGTNLNSGMIQIQFTWASTGDGLGYDNWNADQPILPKSEKFGCIGLKKIGVNKEEYQWSTDVSCFQASRYICQKPAQDQPRAAENPGPSAK